MDPSEAGYGWAADDPRWTDIQSRGQGRLEPPPPPRTPFGAPAPDDTARMAPVTEPSGWPAPAPAPAPAPSWPATSAMPIPGPPPAWPGSGPVPAQEAAPAWPASGSLPTHEPAPAWQPAGPLPDPAAYDGASDATSWIPPVREDPRVGYPSPLPPAPFTAQPQYPIADTGPVPTPWQAGGVYPPAAPDNDQTVVLSRLDRRVQARTRRRGDDEFRRAGRAELFSDDARYGVLFALTAAWYVPVALVFALWVLAVRSPEVPASTRLIDGLPWIGGSTVLSLAVVGLLRWARIGWRALTLSIAAVLISGGVVTIAHTLSS